MNLLERRDSRGERGERRTRAQHHQLSLVCGLAEPYHIEADADIRPECGAHEGDRECRALKQRFLGGAVRRHELGRRKIGGDPLHRD